MNSEVELKKEPIMEGYDVACIGSYGEIHCTNSDELDRIEQALSEIAPGIRSVEETCYFNGKRCGLRFEKGLDVFFRGRVIWWMTQQLSASGWELVSVDSGTRYFKRRRIA